MLEKPIEQWLGLKGISLPPGTPLEDAFADGRLLCTLVRTLSGRSMTGVEWRQPNRASGLHNISVAMQRLKDCPNMAIDMLWRGKDIANCHPTALRSLLADMRAAFG
ncbi:hypothetical protein WJX72_006348 [[Myrmecia] bisecta]|uniref:Calponin-homology (CH) domain-containing protein n=1 Tax=[Myrmecia] bisecta TaxID=41462 RepID=A0AAW1QRU0_9CHLO